jgi:hypothetical protein
MPIFVRAQAMEAAKSILLLYKSNTSSRASYDASAKAGGENFELCCFWFVMEATKAVEERFIILSFIFIYIYIYITVYIRIINNDMNEIRDRY